MRRNENVNCRVLKRIVLIFTTFWRSGDGTT